MSEHRSTAVRSQGSRQAYEHAGEHTGIQACTGMQALEHIHTDTYIMHSRAHTHLLVPLHMHTRCAQTCIHTTNCKTWRKRHHRQRQSSASFKKYLARQHQYMAFGSRCGRPAEASSRRRSHRWRPCGWSRFEFWGQRRRLHLFKLWGRRRRLHLFKFWGRPRRPHLGIRSSLCRRRLGWCRTARRATTSM